MSHNKEIERKYILHRLPAEIENAVCYELRQGYLASGESEVRLRDKAGTFTLTCKQGSGLERVEEEIKLSEEQFSRLWPLTEGKRIEKRRYQVPYGAYTIELDRFSGALHPLLVAEVEFASVEESKSFRAPPYFGQEVTEDKRFKNRSLAEYGLPQ
ncbi:CYTH domain-containing protein [Pelagicoccus albus]|uniref:CYTH domain-containing protein n=1 Tax=Pelagicoccus albus TaxID=415222 RepID=A0A7X1B2P8_9BACT|nr:CYTH domain-containing protein [Pelagicoccus albus]MBC2604559.1 CYTH domain-containing protein [Pelagicoccus albus]